MKASIHMYSGRPAPTFEITGEELQKFFRLFAEAPHTSRRFQSPCHSRSLGYLGFTLVDRTRSEYVEIDVGFGKIEHRRYFTNKGIQDSEPPEIWRYIDVNRQIEQHLLYCYFLQYGLEAEFLLTTLLEVKDLLHKAEVTDQQKEIKRLRDALKDKEEEIYTARIAEMCDHSMVMRCARCE